MSLLFTRCANSNGFCRCFAFQIGKICCHHDIIRHFQFRKCLPAYSHTQHISDSAHRLQILRLLRIILLPPVLNAFKLDYPGIRVQIVEQNSMALEQMLLNGEIDVALLVLPVSDSRIQPTFVMNDEICLIAHENHPIMDFARKFPAASQTTSRIPWYVNLADAIRYEFFLSDYDTILGREARRVFSKNGLQPITCNESLSALMAAALGAAGHGLAFTYYSSRHYFRDAKFLSLGADGASVGLATALPPGRYHSKAALALQEVLLKVLSDD